MLLDSARAQDGSVQRLVAEAARRPELWSRPAAASHPADLVVVLRGRRARDTPILERSGISCDRTLFVDPVLTVAGRRSRAWQCKEIEMLLQAQRDGFILSPYFDYLSYLLEPTWRVTPPAISWA